MKAILCASFVLLFNVCFSQTYEYTTVIMSHVISGQMVEIDSAYNECGYFSVSDGLISTFKENKTNQIDYNI